ncbi:tRNA-methyltransferase-domain-containing protein [Xylariaceae sp. FL0804]|nr:tRNA-methyltransferase-domain-containing protein [Xylariaceae sp. FL0804]
MEVPGTAGLETAAPQRSEIEAREQMDRSLDVVDPIAARGTKRAAEDDDAGAARETKRSAQVMAADDGGADTGADADVEASEDAQIATEAPVLSKNQQKKLRKRMMDENRKKDRPTIRKERRQRIKERKRIEKENDIAAAAAEGRPTTFVQKLQKKQLVKPAVPVPVAVIVDCQFEDKMHEKELVSLANQVTRCYSENRNAQHPVQLYVSSYGGAMKERHETVLDNQPKGWKNVHFVEGDFIEAAREAKESMSSPGGGTTTELLQQSSQLECVTLAEPDAKMAKRNKEVAQPEPEAEDVDKSIVYLTADSPYNLERLEPNTCYVIGGIIDRNREKGLCYKVAREKKVRTAKLPIGEFMVLQSRHVLATNHVMEIMLRWLETGNWGAAFMKVIPTRKGGKLKEDEGAPKVGAGAGETAETRPDGANAADATKPESEHDEDAVEVEGENSEAGLQNNALNQQRWSAPPPELEQVDEKSAS